MKLKNISFKNLLFLLMAASCFSLQARFDLSINHFAYLTKANVKNHLNHYLDLSFNFEQMGFKNSWFYGVEALSVFALDDSHGHYLAAPNFFIGYQIPEILPNYHFHFVLGRQKTNLHRLSHNSTSDPLSVLTHPESFSFMDEVWQLGLWQGRINWDYLLPEPQGLTGAFFTLKQKFWSMTLFLSGLFLPDHEPTVDISPRGDIYSKSRWFNPLQPDFFVFNRRIEAFYWMEKPYLKNILLNESIAFRFRFGDPQTQWINLAYAFKPINQTYFKIDGQFSINEDSINHFIHYQSFKHYLLSMDMGVRHRGMEGVLSVTQELPSSVDVSELWVIPIMPKTLFASAWFKFLLPDTIPWVGFMELGGIKAFFSRSESDISRMKNNMDFHLAATRFKMHSGFVLKWGGTLLQWKKQSLSWAGGYYHSLPEKGDWLNLSLKWQIHSRLKIACHLDIMGSSKNKQENFFNIYKHNDRLRFQMVYIIH